MDRRDLLKGIGWACGLTLGRDASAMAAAMSKQGDKSRTSDLRMQEKIENFNQDFSDDYYLAKDKLAVLVSVQNRLSRAQTEIGFARFNLIAFDELIKVAFQSPGVGAFTKAELDFIEEIFFFDAKKYGFYGDKVTSTLTAAIGERNTVKIPGSGHYLYRGRPEVLYREIVRDIGQEIVLTSGIRSVVKQLHLFLNKAIASDGNLSRASRSLAPPGHSYHGISDFDVGKIGWGFRNFTEHFAQSDVFKRLIDLGYVDIRYAPKNTFGVRFEPWHIKVG